MVAASQEKLIIKNRMLGLLLKDARSHAGQTVEEVSTLLGIPESQIQAFEAGQSAPSLPELELLAFAYNVPIGQFWGAETLRRQAEKRVQPEKISEVLMLRSRILGLRLRQLRDERGITLAQAAEQSGISSDHIQAAENGSISLPLYELEAVANVLRVNLNDLYDPHGEVGSWLKAQDDFEEFARLSPELRAFVLKPINRSYLELAMKLSDMETDRLRDIAASILEITY
jgi:transcriptional regulator with XRE-family HTH domain